MRFLVSLIVLFGLTACNIQGGFRAVPGPVSAADAGMAPAAVTCGYVMDSCMPTIVNVLDTWEFTAPIGYLVTDFTSASADNCNPQQIIYSRCDRQSTTCATPFPGSDQPTCSEWTQEYFSDDYTPMRADEPRDYWFDAQLTSTDGTTILPLVSLDALGNPVINGTIRSESTSSQMLAPHFVDQDGRLQVVITFQPLSGD